MIVSNKYSKHPQQDDPTQSRTTWLFSKMDGLNSGAYCENEPALSVQHRSNNLNAVKRYMPSGTGAIFNAQFLKPRKTATATSTSLGHRHNSDRAFRYIPRTTIRRKLLITLHAQRPCPQHTPELHDKFHNLCFI